MITRIAAIALSCTIGVAPTVAALSPRYQFVASSAQSSFYIDASSLRLRGREATFWVLVVHVIPKRYSAEKLYDRTKILYTHDCDGRESSIRFAASYNGSQLVASSSFHQDAKPIIPGSFSEALHDLACSNGIGVNKDLLLTEKMAVIAAKQATGSEREQR